MKLRLAPLLAAVMAAGLAARAETSTVAVAAGSAAETAAPPAVVTAPPADPLAHELKAVLSLLAERRIAVDPAAAQAAVIEGVARAADPRARLLTPADFEHLQQERAGLDYHPGLRLNMTNATPRIAAVDTNGPAGAAGLQVDDLLLAADGRSLTNATLIDASLALRGHSTNALTLLVQRGGALLTVDVARALAPLPAVESAEKLPRNIGYLRLNGLYKDTGREVVSTLRGWAETGRFGFVLDLRAAGGDDLASVVPIGSLFARGGDLLFTFRDLDEQDLSVHKAAEGDPLETPMLVLVDERTTGAAEVLAAVLADSTRGALLVGAPTGGDALVREALTLPSPDLLYITTRQLVTAQGARYSGAATVEPDVMVTGHGARADGFEPDPENDRRETLDVELTDRALRDRIRGDEALTRAIDVLLGLKALNIRASGVSSP